MGGRPVCASDSNRPAIPYAYAVRGRADGSPLRLPPAAGAQF
jgi:hypothetical protein